jgi:hypothetical protein
LVRASVRTTVYDLPKRLTVPYLRNLSTFK